MSQKVEHTITIAAPPERVWRAWVTEMNAWWTKPYYNDAARVTGLCLEPRLGGRFMEQWGAETGFLIGLVTEWLPAERLGYTWSELGWGGVATQVRLRLETDGAGGTRLHYTQDGFDRLPESDKMREGYDYGCRELLGRVKAHVER